MSALLEHFLDDLMYVIESGLHRSKMYLWMEIVILTRLVMCLTEQMSFRDSQNFQEPETPVPLELCDRVSVSSSYPSMVC